MRVLYLIYHAGNGGSEKYVHDLCVEMQRRKEKAFLGYCIRGKLVEDLERLGIPCFQLDMPSFYSLNAVLKLKALIRENEIELVHAQFSRENYLACFAKILGAKANVIYTSHVIHADGKVKQVLNRMVGKINAKIIAVSQAVLKDLKASNFPEEKLTLLYNGIELPVLAVDEEESKCTAKFRLSEEEVLLVNVSRFSPEKGLDYLLAQFKSAHEKNVALKLVLVGDGEQRQEIVEQIKALALEEAVVLTGYQNQPVELIRACDIYVSSSRAESLGYSILEAMSCALPVIATDVGGCKELINADSDCGYLVEFGSDEFAQRILELSEDQARRKALGKNARAYVQEKFAKDRMMQGTFDMYRQYT